MTPATSTEVPKRRSTEEKACNADVFPSVLRYSGPAELLSCRLPPTRNTRETSAHGVMTVPSAPTVHDLTSGGEKAIQRKAKSENEGEEGDCSCSFLRFLCFVRSFWATQTRRSSAHAARLRAQSGSSSAQSPSLRAQSASLSAQSQSLSAQTHSLRAQSARSSAHSHSLSARACSFRTTREPARRRAENCDRQILL